MTTEEADRRVGPPARQSPAGRLGRLHDERDFLLASLDDLERERDAGDVEGTDFEALRASYTARAAEALREIAVLEAIGRPGPTDGAAAAGRARLRRLRRALGRRRVRRVLGAVGAACAIGIAAITAARLAGVRLPGEVATGSTALPTATAVRQDLDQASTLAGEGKLTAALALYDAVLSDVPHQPEALAYRGWLIRLSGIAAHSALAVREGDAELAAAARIAPRYADGRALDGIALLQDRGALTAAIGQFRAALADGAPAELLRAVGSTMASAFAEAGKPLPARLASYRGARRR